MGKVTRRPKKWLKWLWLHIQGKDIEARIYALEHLVKDEEGIEHED